MQEPIYNATNSHQAELSETNPPNAELRRARATRLVSAFAYRRSWRGGISALDLLSKIRRSKIKALSPEVGLDLEQVSRHAAQAVALGIILSAIVFILLFLSGITTDVRRTFAFDPIASLIGQPIISLGFSLRSQFIVSIGQWLIVAASRNLFTIAAAELAAFEMVFIFWFVQSRNFKQTNYNPNLTLPLPEPLVAFFKTSTTPSDPKQNVIVFGGFYPFVGAGTPRTDWNFVIDLSRLNKSEDRKTPQPVTLAQLYDAVDKAIQARDLPFVSAREILYCEGESREFKADGSLLPNPKARPIHFIDPEVINGRRNTTKVASETRVYRSYSYEDTDHDVVTTAFLHLNRYGNNLYIEGAFRVLAPIDESIYNIDRRIEPGLVRQLIFALLLSAVFIVIPGILWLLLAARLYSVARYFWTGFQENRRQRQMLNRNAHLFNYGIEKTFRESIAADHYPTYFAMKDSITYYKALEECFLKAVLDECEKAGIDVGEWRARANNIINNGIYISGNGSLKADQVGVGTGVQNIVQRVGGAVQQAVSSAAPPAA
jgi:hypothetical protein